MAYIRNLSLSFSLFFSFSSSVGFEHNQPLSDTNHAQQWFTRYVEPMSPGQIHLTMNVLYLLYANAVIESQIQQFFTPLSRLMQSAKSKIIAYQDAQEELATLKKLTERLSYIVSARTIYNQTLTTCLKYYNENNTSTSTITPALHALQSHGERKLITWADEHTDDILLSLQSSANMFNESAQYFHAASGFLRGLSEGELPVEAEEKNRSIVSFDMFLKSSAQATVTVENILNILNTNSDQTRELVFIAHDIYKQHYEIIYAYARSTFNDKHTSTMFDMHGLLPAEYITLLPDSSRIFEHVLQTIKLYTQTELLQ